MAVKDLKNRDRIGITIDKKINESFRELSEQTRIPMSKLVDEAISDLLTKYQGQG